MYDHFYHRKWERMLNNSIKIFEKYIFWESHSWYAFFKWVSQFFLFLYMIRILRMSIILIILTNFFFQNPYFYHIFFIKKDIFIRTRSLTTLQREKLLWIKWEFNKIYVMTDALVDLNKQALSKLYILWYLWLRRLYIDSS